MEFDLYYIIVEQLIGGYWLTILCLMGIIFLIMAVLGKMSKLTVIYYELLFLMAFTVGFGDKFMATGIGLILLTWAYLEFKTSTSG